MDIIVISLGGSVISRDKGVNTIFIEKFAKVIKSEQLRHKFAIAVGGGNIAKSYINAATLFSSSEFVKDEIGINATHINAMLVGAALGINKIAYSLKDIEYTLSTKQVAVIGGLLPGITTDTVAVLAAEKLGARTLINISSSGGIFSDKGTELKKISYEMLIKKAIENDSRIARSNFVFDVIACKLAKRSNIKLHFVNDDMNNIKNAINGKNHEGTVIYPN
ncbi:MAG: hypothetical protein ACP5RP_00720 [Candidatus Micrarchaeia archaeon]